MYYLNGDNHTIDVIVFLRIEFICIIWTLDGGYEKAEGSWGLNLFVLFERSITEHEKREGSWGLNLFVLFELALNFYRLILVLEDWIYLYYLNCSHRLFVSHRVLEDWIYLYYLNVNYHAWQNLGVLEDWIYLYYLNARHVSLGCDAVLEDWIYLYYLNASD